MTDYHNLVIEPLSNQHNRQNFQCGEASLDDYLKKQAKQDLKRRISRIFIASTPDFPSTVVGYYTLSTLFVELDHLPVGIARKLPKHPIPAALIGRLAVRIDAQRFGIGKMLLTDAIKRTLGVSDDIAIYALVVDAIDDLAEQFYQQFGFSLLSSKSRRLCLPFKSI